MKVYILTDVAAEENYTPRVFTNKEAAQQALIDTYNEYLEQSAGAIFSNDLWDTKAEIIYEDDTYNILQLFEVEVEE